MTRIPPTAELTPPPSSRDESDRGDLRPLRVVLVEDDDSDAELIVAELESAGLSVEVTRGTNAAEFRAALAKPEEIDAVLCDYHLPDLDALGALAHMRDEGIDVPLIVVSGGLSDEVATECMRLGAADYVIKDRLRRLPHALTRAIEHGRVQRAGREADRALRASEEVFRALFDQSSVGIALLDVPRNGNMGQSRWNGRISEMMGADSIDYESWTSLFDKETNEELLAKYMQLLTGELDQIRERRGFTRPDGTHVWLDLSTILVRDQHAEPVRWQTLALDITDQVEAEQHLEKRAAKESVLLELTRAGLDGQPTSEFLAAAIRLVVRGTYTQFGTILQMLPSGNHLERVAAHALSGEIPPDPAPIDMSTLGVDVIKSMLRTPRASHFAAQKELTRSAWMIEKGVLASLSVGIYGPISPFGVLSVHTDVAREFSLDDSQFIQSAATIISIAVDRRRGEEQRRLLLGRLVTAQEAERRAIAGDIHDDAVQVMTAANMRLELFRRLLVDPAQLEALQALQETVSLATARLRNLLFELNPPDLERHGLAVAVRRHLTQFEEGTSTSWSLRDDLIEEPAAEPRILLFRIFQEALMNIRKHARPTSVTVSLKTVDGGVLMRVTDDGEGFNVSTGQPQAGHLGLASMRERAEIAGGWWRLKSEPGQGTEITAWVPMLRQSDASPGQPAVVAVA